MFSLSTEQPAIRMHPAAPSPQENAQATPANLFSVTRQTAYLLPADVCLDLIHRTSITGLAWPVAGWTMPARTHLVSTPQHRCRKTERAVALCFICVVDVSQLATLYV